MFILELGELRRKVLPLVVFLVKLEQILVDVFQASVRRPNEPCSSCQPVVVFGYSISQYMGLSQENLAKFTTFEQLLTAGHFNAQQLEEHGCGLAGTTSTDNEARAVVIDYSGFGGADFNKI